MRLGDPPARFILHADSQSVEGALRSRARCAVTLDDFFSGLPGTGCELNVRREGTRTIIPQDVETGLRSDADPGRRRGQSSRSVACREVVAGGAS